MRSCKKNTGANLPCCKRIARQTQCCCAKIKKIVSSKHGIIPVVNNTDLKACFVLEFRFNNSDRTFSFYKTGYVYKSNPPPKINIPRLDPKLFRFQIII